ncbi:hypothetical protein M446_3516 [Methylobacterium sp. 4-46]|nr:hypothetical protein M446_3516 [Methylobacterium sp. 4-46]
MGGRPLGNVESRVMTSIKVRLCGDGTYTVFCDGGVVSTGLTRAQADQLAAVLRSIQGGG